ncbi:hypothetical protein CCACVL1_18018 [Corchorus capsularis]|uniref:DUF4218 domain-containing protein n=1 Tax=Corchorus capsularis TaxID=210143 RepID=A0A1R3HNR6_COCAP|nr:hypothetical protein CCACVL1_18018 [Corchorus capsularis]
MKSHDCHVFMQRLIPIAFREMLPAEVWGPLTELSLLFRIICSSALDINKLLDLEDKAAIILCNLEKIFPPAFFNSMEHLIVHLPYEAIVGGPVQFRWMYPFERFLKQLKKTIKNKSAVEGSICEAYIAYEINTFSLHYFELDVRCTSRRPRRNDEVVNDPSKPPFSIFNYPGRFHGRPRVRMLNDEEKKVAHTYVLRNCPEVDPYLEMFVDYLKHEGHTSDEIDQGIESLIGSNSMENAVTDPLLHTLAWGPSNKATSWPAYLVNGYNFHTFVHGQGKTTINSGICVRGSDANDPSHDFYGILKDVVQIEYCGSTFSMNVVLFEGDWFDPINGMKVHPLYKLVDVNRKKFYRKYDPFILAQQAIQVYYCHYPSMKKDKVDWMVVCETKSRRVIDSASKEESD